MIESLTKEQENKIEFYKKKWEKIGYEYKKIILTPELTDLIKEYLSFANISIKKIFIFDSPYSCILALNMLEKYKNEWVLDEITETDIQKKIDNIKDTKKLKYYSINSFYQSGNIISGYCAKYDFLIEEVIKPDDETLKKWVVFRKINENLHYFFIDKDFVVLSQKPIELHFKGDFLHNENGPSVLYKDGYSLYTLNGVSVSKELVETPGEKLDPKLILTEKNAEIRREIVRKIGIERIIKKIGAKVIEKGFDQKGQPCELLNFDFDGTRRIYIKVISASVPGVFHIESIHPDCNSIEEAFNFRNGTKIKPDILT